MQETLSHDKLPDWVPGDLLLSGDDKGWRDIALRRYHYQGQEAVVPAMSDFMLVSYQRGVTPMQRRFGSRWKNDLLGPGAVSLLTRAQRAEWCWAEPIIVTHLYLSPSLLSSVASEAMDCPVEKVDLADVLRTDDPFLTGVVEAIATEAGQDAMGSPLYVESLGRALSVHLLRRYASIKMPLRADSNKLTPGDQRRITDYIEQQLSGSLTLSAIADCIGMTPDLFSRRFRATYGQPPYRHVTERRVALARKLLAQGKLSIKEIAGLCGFSDQAHMTRVYARETGITPAAFRKHA